MNYNRSSRGLWAVLIVGFGWGASAAHACVAHTAAELAVCLCGEASPHTVLKLAREGLAASPQVLEAGERGAFAFLQAEPVSTTTVHVFDFDYSVNPGLPIVDAVITAGDTVVWSFDTGFHTVTSVAGSAEVYDSGGLSSGTFSHVFDTPGVYTYYCAFHGADLGNGTAAGMSGTITVLAIPEPAAASVVALAVLARRRRR